MPRLTKLRAHQTRASERYDIEEENLATDKEVEERVRKHSRLFHKFRDDNTYFNFDTEGNLTQILTKDQTNTDILQQVDFSFDVAGNLSSIVKEVFDENLDRYLKLQKNFNFDVNGNLESIENIVI